MSGLIGVIGDFNVQSRPHLFTNAALGHLGLAFEWVGTETIGSDPEKRLGSYAGLWIAPSSPYKDMDGALAAIRYARERGVPLVGT